MGVRFACHGCGKGLNIKTELAGKRGKCPDCGLRFRIPREDQALSIPLEDQPSPAQSSPQQHSPQQHLSEQHLSEQHLSEQHLSEQPSAGPATTEQNRLDRVSESAAESAEFNPLAESDVVWYVRPPTGGRYGPATGPTVMGWIEEGRVTGDTLLWRDGWPQWRECQEVIPELLTASPAAALSSAATIPPAARPLGQPPAETGPLADVGGQLDGEHSRIAAGGQLGTPQARSTARREKARQFSASGGYDADSYLLAKKRQKARQRMLAISVLIILSVVLVVALIAALLWEREPPREETIGWRSLGVTSLKA